MYYAQAQNDRQTNAMLKKENESLVTENYRLQAALQNVTCPNCGGPAMIGEVSFNEQQLRTENASLKEEVINRSLSLSQVKMCGLALSSSG